MAEGDGGELRVFITATLDGLRKALTEALDLLKNAAPIMRRAALAIGLAITGAVTASVHAFAEAETAVVDLTAALRTQGITSQTVVRGLIEQATALQQLTGTSDEAIIRAQTLLVTMGLQGEALSEATKAAVNLSVRTGDVQSAATLLGNAVKGETDRLKKYGIVVEEGTPKTLRFAEAVRQANALYGGRAAAGLNTLTGQFKLLKENIGDAAENLGAVFAPALKDVLNYLNRNREGMLGFATGLGNALFEVLETARKFINIILLYKDDVLKFFTDLWTTVSNIGGPLRSLADSAMDFAGAAIADSAKGWRMLLDIAQGKDPTARGGAGGAGAEGGAAPYQIPPFRRGKPGDLPSVAGGSDKKPDEEPAKSFAESWKQAYKEVFEGAGALTESIKSFMTGVVGVLSDSFMQLFTGLADGAMNIGQIMLNIGKTMRDFIFRVIAEALAKHIAANLLAMVSTRKRQTQEIVGEANVAASRHVSQSAGIGPFGFLIGLASVAAVIAAVLSFAKFAKGGMVKGQGQGDTVPAMLTPGEGVLTREQVAAVRKTGTLGGGATFVFQGQFMDDQLTWQRVVRDYIIPELDNYGLKTRSGRVIQQAA